MKPVTEEGRRMQPKLKLVPAEQDLVDIYGKWRAEIEARDWRTVHERGDKRLPVELPDTRKRSWLA